MSHSSEETKNDFQSQPLTASDVKKVAGLSYRQLNDWDSKGALPNNRKTTSGWRKFSPREIFAIMVSSEIRSKFGVPIESLRWIRSFMLQEGADHYRSAIELIARFGFSVYIMTDLKETFVMDSDLEFKDMFQMGYFRGDEPQNYIFIKVNPLVNRLLGCLKKPIELKTHNIIYDSIDDHLFDRKVHSNEEHNVLSLIRDKKYQRISVQIRDGRIISADTEEELSDIEKEKKEKDIIDVIKSKDYQTVTVQKHGGKITRISSKTHIKLGKVTEKT